MFQNQKVKQSPVQVGLLAMFSCFLWGSAFPVLKLSYAYIDLFEGTVGSYIQYAGYRFLLSGGVLVLVMGRQIGLPKREDYVAIGTIALFQTLLQYTFFYMGIANTTGTKASIIAGANVFIALMISAFIFRHEGLTWTKILGCLLGFAGIFLINLGPNQSGLTFVFMGEGFILLANTAYAFSTNFMKVFSQKINPIKIATYQFLIGGLIMVILGRSLGGHVGMLDVKAYGALAYLGVASAIAYVIWSLLLRDHPVSQVTVYGFTTPIFGAICSVILLGEGDLFKSSYVILALILVSVGILMVNRFKGKDIY